MMKKKNSKKKMIKYEYNEDQMKRKWLFKFI